jgi:hypothetical protein
MSKIADGSEEEILIDSDKQTLYHLERYLEQRKQRTKNGRANPQDFFIKLMCDFLISHDNEIYDVDDNTKRIIADNQKLHDNILLLDYKIREINKKLTPVAKEPIPRAMQFAKERCQAMAKYLWDLHPDMNQADMVAHKSIFNLNITGGKNYKIETIKKWVAEVDPRAAEKKIGRPRKNMK